MSETQVESCCAYAPLVRYHLVKLELSAPRQLYLPRTIAAKHSRLALPEITQQGPRYPHRRYSARFRKGSWLWLAMRMLGVSGALSTIKPQCVSQLPAGRPLGVAAGRDPSASRHVVCVSQPASYEPQLPRVSPYSRGRRFRTHGTRQSKTIEVR